jgi:glycyl-tRNA synthetase
MAKLGSVYKGDAGKVAAALAKIPAQEVSDAMQKEGSYMAGNFQVFPEQVDISKQKTIVRGTRFIPHVVEPSFGSDRLFYVALEYAYGIKTTALS